MLSTLSSLFGLGRSTVGKIMVETCAIATHLLPQYVQIPSGEKLKEIVGGFEVFWGFPQAARAIDGSEESASDYYNRKGYYSIIVQALVDHLELFMDVCIGWPEKVHDARVFANSSLHHRGRTSTLSPDWKRNICGVEVGTCMQYSVIYRLLNFVSTGATGNFRRSCLSVVAMGHEALPRDSRYYYQSKML